jgi:hypothetical protein
VFAFAEAANCRPVWNQALQGFNVIQSQQVLEWMAEGETRGEVKGRVHTLLRVLRTKFGTLPADLEAVIQSQTDLTRLDTAADAAVTTPTLTDFRQATNL